MLHGDLWRRRIRLIGFRDLPTPADLTLSLGLAKEDSDKLVKNRPYKTIEELVTKAGIAKVTVDKILEKVTVGP